MITFRYKARNTATGKIEKSTVQGNSESAAAKLLMAQGLVPLEMTPASEEGLLSGLRKRAGHLHSSAGDHAECRLTAGSVAGDRPRPD